MKNKNKKSKSKPKKAGIQGELDELMNKFNKATAPRPKKLKPKPEPISKNNPYM